MIDIEQDVFDTVATRLRSEFKGISVSGEYGSHAASFPAVTISEADNSVYQKMRTSQEIENAVKVMYQIDVYSNKIGSRKLQAKAIMATIDEEMKQMGFTRTMCSQIPNLQDATIFRLSARYEAVVDKDLWIYSQ